MEIWAGARRQKILKVMVRIVYLLFLKKTNNYLFCLWLYWVFAAGRLSLVAAGWGGGGDSSSQCMGVSSQGLL